jgi:uncharacterized pyridoxamine 5'-phosphate oxidase family protein
MTLNSAKTGSVPIIPIWSVLKHYRLTKSSAKNRKIKMLTTRQIYDLLKNRTLYISSAQAEKHLVSSLALMESELYICVNSPLSRLLKETPDIEIGATNESGSIMILSAAANYAYRINHYDIFMLKNLSVIKNEIWEEFSPFTQFGVVDEIDRQKDYATFENGINFSDI